MNLLFRDTATGADIETIRSLVESTGFFRPDEVDVAVELVEERLAKGERSGYHFVFAQDGSRTVGYSCFGPIACTISSFDLYWIAVDRSAQRRGLGRRILAESEKRIAQMRGRRVYIETSSRPQYGSTRRFYESCGYRVAAELEHFYDQDDGKVIFVKMLG